MSGKPSPITPSVLAWALAEDGRPPVEIAEALKIDEAVLDEWEQRLQGPPDPVVVEHVDLALGQPQQARVVAGGPLAQGVQRLATQHQVGHHDPDRGRWTKFLAGVPGAATRRPATRAARGGPAHG